MKLPRPTLSAQGSVLVVAMVMTMLGGLFIAGWMGLASMRAAYASNSEYAARRRMMLENSKAYAMQIARQNAMNGNASLGGAVSLLSDGTQNWGGIDTNGGWANLKMYSLPTDVSFPYATNYSLVHPYNGVGLHPGASFLSTQLLHRPGGLQASAEGAVAADPSTRFNPTMNAFNAYLFMKAICPCLAGDGLVVYRKPDIEPGEIELAPNLYIDGRLVVRDPACFYNSTTVNLGAPFKVNALCKSFYLQKLDERNRVTGTYIDNTEIPPSNMPAVPSTYGPYPSATPLTASQLYRGDLNVVQNNANPSNSLWHIQQREADAGRATLQTISSGTAFGLTTDPVYIRDEGTDPRVDPPYYPPNWPSGYVRPWKVLYINLDHTNLPNLRIYPVVQSVVFLGQQTRTAYDNAGGMAPRSVLLMPPASGINGLLKTFFAFENNRPFILAAKGNREPLELSWKYGKTVPAVTTPLTLDWKLLLINEYRQVTLFLPETGGVDSVAIVGGFLTNWSIKRHDAAGAAKFKIAPQWLTDGDAGSYALASVLPRDAWVESFFQLAAP